MLRLNASSWITVALLALAAPALAQAKFDADKISDDTARKHWKFLSIEEREDCHARFEAEVPHLGTFQSQLIQFARSLEERDIGYLPGATPTPIFDPTEHAPRQPIARTPLDPDSKAAKNARALFLKRLPPRKLQSAWSYDWGSGEVVRTGEMVDVERDVANALAGYAPGHDLALALIERALDDGSQRKALFAFGHAYTDRTGTVFPGVTLFDAWSSGEDLEMPDVDVLGIVHVVRDEWKRWIAPVPESQHKALYDTVGEIFQAANRHRGLRQAIALAYLEGAPPLPAPYPTCIARFHGLWESKRSTPSEVAAMLPTSEGWSEFLVELDTNLHANEALKKAALVRRQTLENDARAVRAFWLRVMWDAGAFQRKSLPPPKPTPAKPTREGDK